MFTFLLIVHAIIAAALVGVILMQRSEGGGLGMGQGPAGLMTARGAADFLTRATTILATMFVVMSIFLAGLASVHNRPGTIDTSLVGKVGTAPVTPAPTPASPADPLNGPAAATSKPDAVPVPGPANVGNTAVPMAR